MQCHKSYSVYCPGLPHCRFPSRGSLSENNFSQFKAGYTGRAWCPARLRISDPNMFRSGGKSSVCQHAGAAPSPRGAAFYYWLEYSMSCYSLRLSFFLLMIRLLVRADFRCLANVGFVAWAIRSSILNVPHLPRKVICPSSFLHWRTRTPSLLIMSNVCVIFSVSPH